MANLSSGFIEGLCSSPTNTEQWEAFQAVSPDISAAKGHQEGHLQQGAINSFYIGSFFTGLPLARTPCAHALLPDIYREQRPESSQRDAEPAPSSSCHTPSCAKALPCQGWLLWHGNAMSKCHQPRSSQSEGLEGAAGQGPISELNHNPQAWLKSH